MPEKDAWSYLPFKCQIVDKEGKQCGLCFQTYSALRTHQRCANQSGHGFHTLEALCTPTNACVICDTRFSSLKGAREGLKLY